jgi:hypothetical protein
MWLLLEPTFRMNIFLRSVLQLLVAAKVVPSSLILPTWKCRRYVAPKRLFQQEPHGVTIHQPQVSQSQNRLEPKFSLILEIAWTALYLRQTWRYHADTFVSHRLQSWTWWQQERPQASPPNCSSFQCLPLLVRQLLRPHNMARLHSHQARTVADNEHLGFHTTKLSPRENALILQTPFQSNNTPFQIFIKDIIKIVCFFTLKAFSLFRKRRSSSRFAVFSSSGHRSDDWNIFQLFLYPCRYLSRCGHGSRAGRLKFGSRQRQNIVTYTRWVVWILTWRVSDWLSDLFTKAIITTDTTTHN